MNFLTGTELLSLFSDSNDAHSKQKCRHATLNFRFKNNNGLKIAHLNVRSILPKIEQMRIMVEQSNVDILAISEIWLDSNIFDFEIDIPKYDLLRRDRNRHGGGVALYIRNDLEFKPRSDINEGSNVECVWAEVIPKHVSPILVCSIYRPPSADAAYLNNITDIIKIHHLQMRRILIT